MRAHALLLDLLAGIDALNTTVIEQQNVINRMNATINNLNNTVIELQSTTDYLNTTVNYLNQTVAILNSTRGLGTPDYDSGVLSLQYGYNYFAHNLNTTQLFVYLIGIDSSGEYHQVQYGGAAIDQYGTKRGAWWLLTDKNTILVYKETHTDNNYVWSGCRIMIWKLS